MPETMKGGTDKSLIAQSGIQFSSVPAGKNAWCAIAVGRAVSGRTLALISSIGGIRMLVPS